MTPWVWRLILINVVAFFFTGSEAGRFLFGLQPQLVLQKPWSLVTYMFVHGDFGHLFFNMLGLFFFGPRLEMRLGARDFLMLYFLSGLGGALFSFVFAFSSSVIGASGAVYGVLAAFAFYWPRQEIYIWMILPVQAWILVTMYLVISVMGTFGGAGSNIAHFAHLGGLVVAFLYLRTRERKRRVRKVERPNSHYKAPGVNEIETRDQWMAIPLDRLHELNRIEVEKLQQKINELGMKSLSPDERAFLDRMMPNL